MVDRQPPKQGRANDARRTPDDGGVFLAAVPSVLWAMSTRIQARGSKSFSLLTLRGGYIPLSGIAGGGTDLLRPKAAHKGAELEEIRTD